MNASKKVPKKLLLSMATTILLNCGKENMLNELHNLNHKPDSLSILMDLCNQLDLPLSITMAGRGTAVQSMLDLLGIESNERRISVYRGQ